MSQYKSIGNYSSGSSVAPIRAPVMMYQSNPVHNQRAPMEIVPSYGTVGYDEPVTSTYRGYYSLCSGYSDPQGVGCGVTDPSDPCYQEEILPPSVACLQIMQALLTKLNAYKIPQLIIVPDPTDPTNLSKQRTFRILDNILNTVNSFIYNDQACVNAQITGTVDDLVNGVVDTLVTNNMLLVHELDKDKKPIVLFDNPLFKLEYNPILMEIMAVPLPVNKPVVSSPVVLASSRPAPRKKGLFGIFGRK